MVFMSPFWKRANCIFLEPSMIRVSQTNFLSFLLEAFTNHLEIFLWDRTKSILDGQNYTYNSWRACYC